MTTPVIIDAIVVMVLVAFVVMGTIRGALRTLAGLVIVVVALVGAGMAASTFSEPVTKLTAPLIEQRVSQKVESVLGEQLGQLDLRSEAGEFQLKEVLEHLGLDEAVRKPLLERARQSVADTGTAVATAVAESLIHSAIYGLLYVLSFLILLLLLNILLKAMDLVTKLPVIHAFNALGGGILGLTEGALLLFLAVWVARKFGVSFETELFGGAHILRIFTTHTPLSVLSFLH